MMFSVILLFLGVLCVGVNCQNTTTETNPVIQKISTSTSTSTNVFQNATTSTTTESSSSITTPSRPVDVSCLPLHLMGEMDHVTQEEFTAKLTESCRYDRLIKPKTPERLVVNMQIDLTHIESNDAQQMKSFILVQLSYKDSRLKYDTFSPKRGSIQGEDTLRSKIWVPHLIVRNERESSLMGLDGKDVFIQILPDGQVTYSYRMTLTFYCWMNLKKFPFDYQICKITWISWSYDDSNLSLEWADHNNVQISENLHLTEFVLDDYWVEKQVAQTSFSTGGLAGNYSSLVFSFKLRREIGYYMMDYFLPSMFLVVTSWVTFWLQADASAPRAVLGTSTMLSFITLNSGLTKNLPKVSYIKASEIWFLGCSSFIFLSLTEFAFVNVIWRRKKQVEVKKPNSKYILKGAVTPSLLRKQLKRSESFSSLHKTRSCTNLNGNQEMKEIQQNNYLTVHSFPTIPASRDELINIEDSVTTIPVPENNANNGKFHDNQSWTTMTPQEVAIWIDKKSRIVFPVGFLIFNVIYWTFVYYL